MEVESAVPPSEQGTFDACARNLHLNSTVESAASLHSLGSVSSSHEVGHLCARLNYVDGHRRIQSVSFLFAGALLGICGFVLPGLLGIWKYKFGTLHDGRNFLGDRFPSGHNYHPLTVSEMVHDFQSAEGKVFFACCFSGALCILVSAYPFSLRNVYIGDQLGFIVPFCGKSTSVSVLHLRQFFPPIGMMLVCCITVTTGPRDFAARCAATVHTVGACMMIAGYIFFEIHALWFSPLVRCWPRERRMRKALIIICGICAIGFEVCGALSTLLSKHGVSCDSSQSSAHSLCTDKWRIPTLEDIDYGIRKQHNGSVIRMKIAHEDQQSLLYNTARDGFLYLKMANFWFEVFAGLSMIGSHLIIWYFCPERQLGMCDSIPDIHRVYRQMDDVDFNQVSAPAGSMQPPALGTFPPSFAPLQSNGNVEQQAV